MITIESPARAALLIEGTTGPSLVEIRGQAYDEVSPITELSINSVPLSIGGGALGESFNVQQESRWGLSVVRGLAKNAAGDAGYVAHSFLRSPLYCPGAQEGTSHVAEGLLLQINQPAFDLIAQLGEAAINALNLDRYVPPVFQDNVRWVSHNCGFWTERNRTGRKTTKNGTFTHQGVQIDLRAVIGGFEATVRMAKMKIPLKITEYIDLWCSGERQEVIKGTVKADTVTVQAVLLASVGENGGIDLVMDEGWPVITYKNYDFDTDYIGPIDDYLDDQVKKELDKKVPGMVMEMVRGDLAGYLSGFAPKDSIDLSDYYLPVVIQASAEFDLVEFRSGYALLGTKVKFMPKSVIPEHQKTVGSILGGGARPVFSNIAYDFGIGIRDDMINQFLWAIWLGGGFDLDDMSRFVSPEDLEGVDVHVFAELPPLIMPGTAGHDIDVGWGDLRVEATVDPSLIHGKETGVDASFAGSEDLIHVEVYVSTVFGASIELDAERNVLQLTFDPNLEVYAEVARADGPGNRMLYNMVIGRILRSAIPPILNSALKEFPVSEFDLGAALNRPEMTFRLDNGSVGRQDRCFYLTGGLVQVTE